MKESKNSAENWFDYVDDDTFRWIAEYFKKATEESTTNGKTYQLFSRIAASSDFKIPIFTFNQEGNCLEIKYIESSSLTLLEENKIVISDLEENATTAVLLCLPVDKRDKNGESRLQEELQNFHQEYFDTRQKNLYQKIDQEEDIYLLLNQDIGVLFNLSQSSIGKSPKNQNQSENGEWKKLKYVAEIILGVLYKWQLKKENAIVGKTTEGGDFAFETPGAHNVQFLVFQISEKS